MENKYAFRANPDGFVSYRIVTVNSLSGQKMPKSHKTHLVCGVQSWVCRSRHLPSFSNIYNLGTAKLLMCFLGPRYGRIGNWQF